MSINFKLFILDSTKYEMQILGLILMRGRRIWLAQGQCPPLNPEILHDSQRLPRENTCNMRDYA